MNLTIDERWIEGWRGPLLAALIALLAGLPTLMTLGPTRAASPRRRPR